ncbi:hypothetical protein LCGC14_0570450 [marine sediment metagenome]|uniref:Uncharacterized protein n=1 Tax=marine sediment metagenome TaxID=412755 RepID=A0A0F9USM1_9ZZZZ
MTKCRKTCHYFDEYDHDKGHEWFCTHDLVTKELGDYPYWEIVYHTCEHYKAKRRNEKWTSVMQ